MLSIITINYNNKAGLKKTIESVISQDFRGYEHIIIDGASKDDSVGVINLYQRDIVKWVSEPDNGVYHAMNKGIKQATGEYLLFLNSGDFFYSSDSLSNLMKEVNGEDLVYGNLMVQEANKRWIKEYPSVLNFSYFLEDTLPHPATLIKKSLIDKVGYNENFRIVSDWEFFIVSICKKGAAYKHVDQTVSVFNFDGISSDPGNSGLLGEERTLVLEKHFKTFLSDYEQFSEVQHLYQQLLRSKPQRALSKIKGFPLIGAFFKS